MYISVETHVQASMLLTCMVEKSGSLGINTSIICIGEHQCVNSCANEKLLPFTTRVDV